MGPGKVPRSDVRPTRPEPRGAAAALPNGNGKRHVNAKTRRVMIKVTPEQYRIITDRARSRGLPAAVWMRAILLLAATSQAGAEGGRGYVRIREPSGNTT